MKKPRPEGTAADVERLLQGLVNLDALTVIFRQHTERTGTPVVLRADAVPEQATVRLMQALGVPVEVRPVTDRLAPPISTGIPLYCPHKDCRWSFDRVGKRGEGFLDVHLRVIHKGQPDPRKALVVVPPPPGPSVPIEGGPRGAKPQTAVQQTPRTREAAAAAQDEPVGETAVTATARVVASGAKRRGRCADCGDAIFPPSERCMKCHSAAKAVWTRDAILDAIRRYAAANGHPPSVADWLKADPANGYPNFSTCYGKKRPFPKWADAIEAAGFPRPGTGVRRSALSGREPQGRETPATPGASPAETTAGLTAARTVCSDSPGPVFTAEPGSRPENAGRRAALARVLRSLADAIESDVFSDAALGLICHGLALEARKGLDA